MSGAVRVHETRDLFHDPVRDPAGSRLALNGAVGWRVPNGAVILRSAPALGRPHHYVVLCLSHGEFVTWILGTTEDETRGDTFWGNYHAANLAAALADFEERVQ